MVECSDELCSNNFKPGSSICIAWTGWDWIVKGREVSSPDFKAKAIRQTITECSDREQLTTIIDVCKESLSESRRQIDQLK